MLATLIATEKLSDSVTTYHFQPERPLDHIAGQFTELTLPHDNPDSRGTTRQFTISSSPTEKDVAITIKFAHGQKQSSFKQALHTLKPGATLHMSDPLGDFVLPLDTSQPLVWIAGGIGITPFRSIAKWLLDSGEQREIKLFHSLRDQGDALFQDIFQQAGIGEQATFETATGQRLSISKVITSLSQPQAQLWYVSGPKPMVESVLTDLRQAGIDRNQIVTDAFLGYTQV